MRQIAVESGTSLYGFDLKEARKADTNVNDLITFLETVLSSHVSAKSLETFVFAVKFYTEQDFVFWFCCRPALSSDATCFSCSPDS